MTGTRTTGMDEEFARISAKMYAREKLIQDDTLDYFRHSIPVIVKKAGGLEAWNRFTKAQREEHFGKLFDKEPVTLLGFAFANQRNTVAFEHIFYSPDGGVIAAKWRKAFRIVFVYLSDCTFLYHAAVTADETTKEAKEAELVKQYKGRMKTQAIKDCELGEAEDLPVRPRDW